VRTNENALAMIMGMPHTGLGYLGKVLLFPAPPLPPLCELHSFSEWLQCSELIDERLEDMQSAATLPAPPLPTNVLATGSSWMTPYFLLPVGVCCVAGRVTGATGDVDR